MTQTHTRPALADRILDCFPAGTYALNTLLSLVDITESEEVTTAAVECRAEPRLLVNPHFADRHAATPEKLLMLVMHELHHVLLGHTRLFPRLTPVDNLVFDAVINALLCRMFPALEYTSFFTDFYDEAAFPACFLRPPTAWTPEVTADLPAALLGQRTNAVREVYRALYSDAGATYTDLYRVLREEVSDEQVAEVPLIGDHGACGSSDGNLEERAPILLGAVRQIVERWPQPPDPIAGRSLDDLLRKAGVDIRRHQSNRQLLRSLLRKVGGVSGGGVHRRRPARAEVLIDSPIPTLSRRSTVLRALGMPQLLYPTAIQVPRPVPAGERVHIYLDVSGSIGDLKGALYGAVLDCSAFVHPTVHLFSTVVADVSLEALRRGECMTTGGTAIECVAEHMATHKVRRAALITDGYTGPPRGKHMATFGRAQVGVALTPGVATRDDLASVTNFWAELRATGDNR